VRSALRGASGVAGTVAAAAADECSDREGSDRDEQPEQNAGGEAEATEREGDELDDAEAEGEQRDDQQDDQQDAAHPREDPGGGGRKQQAHGPQREHLAACGRLLTEPLDGVAQIAGPAFGERERGVGHAPQLHALLGAGGSDGALEVGAGLLGVEALGGASAENRQRRGLELGLGLELLVGALLERLNGLGGAALLDPDLSLFGGHRLGIVWVSTVVRVKVSAASAGAGLSGGAVSPVSEPVGGGISGRGAGTEGGRGRYARRWESSSMRPSTPITAARIAACAALSLSLLAPAAADASEAGNLFGGAAQSSTQAAKPVHGAGKSTPVVKQVEGAGKVTTQAVKQSAAGVKTSQQPAKVPSQVTSTPKITSTPKVTTTTATTATQESSSGTSSSLIIALVLGVLLLGGIAFVIVRDARSVAPVVEGATGGTRNPEGRLRKRRAQAKAARRQRKRHRRR
jgi:hypothetical protein